MADTQASRPKHLPKPNTQFLRNIIKVTDSHNKALLAKEAEESRARLKDLDRASDRHKSRDPSQSANVERQDKLRSRIQDKRDGRSRKSEDDDRSHRLHRTGEDRILRDARRSRTDGARHRSDSTKDDSRRDSRRHRSSKSLDTYTDTDSKESKRDSRRRRHSKDRRSRHQGQDQHARRYRSRSPTKHRSHEKSSKQRLQYERSRSPSRPDNVGREDKPIPPPSDDGSSSGDESIGPAPPQAIRGRGDIGESSGIDRRFSDSYDPKVDIEWPGETNAPGDWDATVAAYRSRKSRNAQVDQD